MPRRRRSTAPLVVAALLLGAAARPAAAQAPCIGDVLGAYLAPGFSCRIAGVTFADFAFATTHLAAVNGTITDPDPARVVVIPFDPGSSVGIPGIGFLFLDPANPFFLGGVANGVQASTDAPLVDVRVRSVFGFSFAAPAHGILDAGYGATLSVEKTLSEDQFLATSTVVGDVRGPGGVCLDAVASTLGAAADAFPEEERPCVPGPLLTGTATFTFESRLLRDATTGTPGGAGTAIGGSVVTSLDWARLGVAGSSVVPEPATLALLGGGLLALGLTTRGAQRTRWKAVCRR